MKRLQVLHRWIATGAFFFLLWISLTGVLLAVDSMWPPQNLVASEQSIATQGGWLNDPGLRFKIHILLQDLHRGTILGLPGQLVDILAGLCFVFLAISGSIMYFKMLKTRRRTGRGNWFWTGGTGIRSAHRWLSSAFMVPLVYITVTGSITAIAQLVDGETDPPPPPMNSSSEFGTMPAPPTQAPPMQAPPASGAAGSPLKGPPQREKTFAAVVQDLHSGSTFGRWGEWLMLFTGIVAGFLAITGIWVYLNQLRRRRTNGQTKLFWG